jgi:hypothetical protein
MLGGQLRRKRGRVRSVNQTAAGGLRNFSSRTAWKSGKVSDGAALRQVVGIVERKSKSLPLAGVLTDFHMHSVLEHH